MKRKAFTLIELIAVLVILAILALIVTPLVMSIIKKARISADKRSVDAYGRSVELAIASYLLDTGTFPTDISQLTIEYSGDEVVCTTTQLNSDSSVYLAKCTVGGRSVEGYTYGTDTSPSYAAYSVGDEVTYNNVDYYVIKDSEIKESTVTLLKAEPLTVEEVNTYGGVGTENNHVNMYSASPGVPYYQAAYDVKYDGTVGGMAYYSSETCGYDSSNNSQTIGCTSAYENSEIKYVVDAWADAKVPEVLQEVRLLKFSELIDNLGYELSEEQTGYQPSAENTPTWVYGNDCYYWMMSPYNDSLEFVYIVDRSGSVGASQVFNISGVVRPVIVLKKTVLD